MHLCVCVCTRICVASMCVRSLCVCVGGWVCVHVREMTRQGQVKGAATSGECHTTEKAAGLNLLVTLHCLWSSCSLTTQGRVGAAAPPPSSLTPPPFPGGWWDGGRVCKDLLLPTHSERLYRTHTQPAQTPKGSHRLAQPPAPSPQPPETRRPPPPPLPPQPESPHRLTETADSFLKMELLSP